MDQAPLVMDEIDAGTEPTSFAASTAINGSSVRVGYVRTTNPNAIFTSPWKG
jgi:hypothetical protein